MITGLEWPGRGVDTCHLMGKRPPQSGNPHNSHVKHTSVSPFYLFFSRLVEKKIEAGVRSLPEVIQLKSGRAERQGRLCLSLESVLLVSNNN